MDGRYWIVSVGLITDVAHCGVRLGGIAGIGEREPHHGGVVLIDMNVKLMLLSFGCRSRLGSQTAGRFRS